MRRKKIYRHWMMLSNLRIKAQGIRIGLTARGVIDPHKGRSDRWTDDIWTVREKEQDGRQAERDRQWAPYFKYRDELAGM